MYKKVLGRATWKFLHLLGYSEEKNPKYWDKMHLFVNTLSEIYPCVECRDNFKKHLKELKPDFNSGPTFRKFVCQLHNSIFFNYILEVNKMLGKPEYKC